MTGRAIAQAGIFLAILTLFAVPLGHGMARWLNGGPGWMGQLLGPVERLIYRVAGVDPTQEMSWRRYAASVLGFNLVGICFLYALQRLQGNLPFNPNGLGDVGPEVAFNTAVSFVSNTNWQTYGGETTMSHLTQMLGLTSQNFLSAATGIAVLLAFVRSLGEGQRAGVGNYWVDLVRSVLYVLLPLSLGLALLLVSQGVVQTLAGSAVAQTLESGVEQVYALGPVASQVAIKQLGTNGGGYYNVNSAHPFENPTSLSNFFELLAILLIPAALCFTFGSMLKDRRQGWAIYAAMTLIFVPVLALTLGSELSGNPRLANLGVDDVPSLLQSGGNLEGKETRFGITSSALWAVATTAASNGSVNSMHDSYTPLGGLGPMWLMQLGEIVYGGVGSGLYGMLMYAIVAVFIAGLMVGRTPEYVGKKVEAFEMKMASLVILLPAAAVLVGTAIACSIPEGTGALANPGPHGFSEILYAFSSGANNNGSAFGGLTVNGPFYATAIGVAMLIGRYWVIVPVLAAAGSLAKKKRLPPTAGTLPTHGPLFIFLLVGTVVLVGALTFIPALALGPVIEALQLRGAS
ncbi:MAG: potassium-transporting ATPase subunit KdpA [Deltaproteobacteria bacterium]|nr:potassium-transporting ATPase subunit KdpA [Deltaproteobacteria bacterium]